MTKLQEVVQCYARTEEEQTPKLALKCYSRRMKRTSVEQKPKKTVNYYSRRVNKKKVEQVPKTVKCYSRRKVVEQNPKTVKCLSRRKARGRGTSTQSEEKTPPENMWWVDFSIFADDDARALLKRLGLEEFCFQPVPCPDKKLCSEFLATFDVGSGCGTVRGKQVKLDTHSVAAVTRLPLGSDSSDAEVGLESVEVQSSATDRAGCNTLNKLVFGEDDDIVMKIAAMILMKLHPRNGCLHDATLAVILALDKSIIFGMEMRWADYFTQVLLEAVTEKNCVFPFGEWLTQIINNAVDVQDQQQQLETVDEQLKKEVVRLKKLVDEGKELVSLLLESNGTQV